MMYDVKGHFEVIARAHGHTDTHTTDRLLYMATKLVGRELQLDVCCRSCCGGDIW